MLSFLSKKKEIKIKAPVKGVLKNIEDVRDPVFAQKMMGDGVAIQYVGGDVYAPISGEITVVVLPSMHAYGIRSDEGVEILVHVGLETVNLKGEGFRFLKQIGDYVTLGDKLIEVDYDLLKRKEVDLITPIILTNKEAYSIEKKESTDREVDINDTIFYVKKK